MPRLSFLQFILYPILRKLLFFLFTYLPYGKVRFNGFEKINFDVPLILAPSHSNYLCDVPPVGVLGKLPPKFIAKHTLFVLPIETFVRFCGGVPVVRAEDTDKPGGDRARNRHAFVSAIEAIKEGWNICIFPEGVSIQAPGLVMPLKSGVAKLALAAEDAADFKLGLQILPMAYEYGERTRVGSGIDVNIGSPIVIKKWEELYRQSEPKAAKEIMAEISIQMRNLFPHFESWDDFRASQRLKWLGLVNNRRAVALMFARISSKEKSELLSLLAEFIKASQKEKLPIWMWAENKFWKLISDKDKFLRVLGLFILFPFWIWSFLNNTISDLLIGLLARVLSEDETEIMTKRIMISPIVFLGIYHFQVRFLNHINFCLYVILNIFTWYLTKRTSWICNQIFAVIWFKLAGPSEQLRISYLGLAKRISS